MADPEPGPEEIPDLPSTAEVEAMFASIRESNLPCKERRIKRRAAAMIELLNPTADELTIQLKAENFELRLKNRQLEAENAKLIVKNRKFETKLDSLERDPPHRGLVNQLRNSVKVLQARMHHQEDQICDLDIQKSSLQRKIKSLNRDLHHLRFRVMDVRRDRLELQRAVDILTGDRADMLIGLHMRREVSRRIGHATRMQIGASIRAAHAAMQQDDTNSANGTEEDEDAAEVEDEDEDEDEDA